MDNESGFIGGAMNNAIRTAAILGSIILLLLASVGCASQKSIDDLSKQMADVDARLTKLEQAETQRSNETAAKDKNKTLLDKAIADAAKHRQDCKATAELDFNDWVRANGTRAPGKAEVYTAPPEALKQVHAKEDKAEADCQEEYEDALKAAQFKYPQ
jgi:outer membrane murein-binding lipoprotein Lpp